MAVESYEKLMGDLKKLRLPAMTEMLDSYVKQAASNSMSYMDFLSGLVSEEVRYKEQRAVQSRIKSARFPVLKNLDDLTMPSSPVLTGRNWRSYPVSDSSTIRRISCFWGRQG